MKLHLFALLLIIATDAAAGPMIYTPVASIGPNPYGPGYTAYASAAIAALEAHTAGAQPGANSVTVASRDDIIVTDYPSWLGETPPPAGYEDAWGSALFIGVHIVDLAATFNLAGLRVFQSSTDPYNYFNYAAGYGDSTYAFDTVGIWYGPDGVKGTADDAVYANGEAPTRAINELIYVGLSAGYPGIAAYGYTPDQAGLDQARADFATLGDYDITTTYSVNGVPEPATVGLAAAALAALLVCRARR